jgi:hypothetical protein
MKTKIKRKKMKKEDLKQIIKEEIKNILKEQDPKPTTKQSSMDVTTISKDLADQKSNFANILQKKSYTKLLDDIADKLGPKTVESPAFKQAVFAFYNKHK